MRRVLVVILIVAAVAAVLSWAIAGPVLRLAIERVAAASEGRLQVEGVQGSLFGAVRIERLRWRDALAQAADGPPRERAPETVGASTLTLEEIRADWRPLALLAGEFDLVRLSVKSAVLELPRSSTPPTLPATLALPMRVRVGAARLERLRIAPADGAPIELGPIELRARYAPGGYRIDGLRVDTAWGVVDAAGRLGDAAPFAIEIDADASARLRGGSASGGDVQPARIFALSAALRGALEDIVVEARAVRRKGPRAAPDDEVVVLHTRVQPFAATPWSALEASFTTIDLANWGVGVDLRTSLSGSATISPDPGGTPESSGKPAASAAAGAGFALSGAARISNAAAGRIDDRALPIAALDTRFRWQAGRLALEGLSARTVGDGVLEGRASVDTTRVIELPWVSMPSLEFDLRLRAIDPAALSSGLPRAAIEGRVVVAGQRFDVDLKDASRPEVGLAALGTVGAQRLTLERATLSATPAGTLGAAGSVELHAPYLLDLDGRFDRVDPARLADLAEVLAGRDRRAGAAAAHGRAAAGDPAGRGEPDSTITSVLARLPGAVSGRWSMRGPALAARTVLSVASATPSAAAASSPLAPSAPSAPPAPSSPSAKSAAPLRLQASLADGALAGLRARGTVAAAVLGDRLGELRLALDLGATHLDAEGALGGAGERIAFALRAGSLAQLAPVLGVPALSGSAVVEGELRGTLASPAIAVRGRASALAVGDRFAARSLSMSLDLPQLSAGYLDAKLGLRVEGTDLRAGATPIRSVTVRVDGTARAHALRVQIEGERFGGRIGGEGSMTQAPRWSGTLAELVATGAVPARLVAPVAIEWTPGEVRAGATRVESEFGQVRVGRAAWRDGRVELVADATLLRLGQLLAATGLGPAGAAPDPGLDALAIEMQADIAASSLADATGRIAAKLRAVADAPARNGGVAGNGDLVLAIREGALDGTLALTLPTLAFANRIIGPEWSIDGQMGFAGRVTGTVAAPRLIGEISGDRLALDQRSMGWRMRDGTLAGRFDGERLRIDALTFRSVAKETGSVALRGEVRVADGVGHFALTADRLAVPIGPGQRLVVSGNAEVASTDAAIELKGRLRADEGRIELAGGDAPTMPADIVILPSRRGAAVGAATGTTTGAATGAATGTATGTAASTAAAPGTPAPAAVPASRKPLSISSDVTLDLGDGVRVHGSGVDALLVGSVNLRGRLPQAPRAFGTVRVSQGHYRAYGQQLEIVRGVFVFNGPLDNPVLDIVALRREQAVEAGVALTGTVLSPRVRLTSQPDVPDAEKLSWLVLGVPLDSAQSSGQGAALQAAAATLFGRNDGGLSGGLARAFGLDVLAIRSASTAGGGLLQSGFGGGLGAALPPVPGQVGAPSSTPGTGGVADNVVTVGKRLGPRLFVTYEQGLRGVWNLLRIQYDISRRLALRAQTGSESALDLLYSFTFD